MTSFPAEKLAATFLVSRSTSDLLLGERDVLGNRGVAGAGHARDATRRAQPSSTPTQPSSMHVRPFICTASAPRNARSTSTAAARQSTVPAQAAPEKTGSRSSGESLRSKFSGATPSQRTVSWLWQMARPSASVASMPSTVMWSSSDPCTVLETSMPRQLI